MKVLASADVVAFIRERGGALFVWVERLRDPGGFVYLEASTESPGAGHSFRTMRGSEFDLMLDVRSRELPDEIHLRLVGRRRRRIRAYWNGAPFVR